MINLCGNITKTITVIKYNDTLQDYFNRRKKQLGFFRFRSVKYLV